MNLPMGIIKRVLKLPPAPVGTPGPFSLADDHVLERSFVQAGFTAVAIERHNVTLEYPSVENLIEERQATSANIRILLAEASAPDRAAIWQAVAQAVLEYQDGDGVLRVPNETLCVVGTA